MLLFLLFKDLEIDNSLSNQSDRCHRSSSTNSICVRPIVTNIIPGSDVTMGLETDIEDSECMLSEEKFLIAMNLAEARLGFELRPHQLIVLRKIIKDKISLILGAPTNFGKSLCILLPAFCSSLDISGWKNRNILCIVPNHVVLDSILKMLKDFKGISYCSPGRGRDKNVSSEESLTGKHLVVIWTGHRVSTFFQGVLNKNPLSKTLVSSRVLLLQHKMINGLVVIDECHTSLTDRFLESAASARLIREVSKQ